MGFTKVAAGGEDQPPTQGTDAPGIIAQQGPLHLSLVSGPARCAVVVWRYFTENKNGPLGWQPSNRLTLDVGGPAVPFTAEFNAPVYDGNLFYARTPPRLVERPLYFFGGVPGPTVDVYEDPPSNPKVIGNTVCALAYVGFEDGTAPGSYVFGVA